MLLIKGGNVHLKTGQVTVCDVLVKDSRIEKIGKDIGVPENCEVMDASGMEVFPGFIIPLTSVGLLDFTTRLRDNNEKSEPLTPQLNVKDSLDRREVYLQQYHYTGITAFGASPGSSNVISGQVGVYNTVGKTMKDMCIKEFAALKGNFVTDVKNSHGKEGKAPMTRMGIAAMMRGAFEETRRYMEKPAADREYDSKKEALAKALNKEVKMIINAQRSAEVAAVMEIAREYGLALVINEAYQAHTLKDEILQAGYPIILGQLHGSSFADTLDVDYSILADMNKKGLPVCCSTSGDSRPAGRETLLWSAIKMYQKGVDPEDVINMMTINPAKTLGVDHIIGSIEEGKQADIAVYKGHPVKTYAAHVEFVVVAGNVVYKNTGRFERCYV